MPYATYRFNKIIAAETIRFIVTVAIVVYKGLKLVVYRMLTVFRYVEYSSAKGFKEQMKEVPSVQPEYTFRKVGSRRLAVRFSGKEYPQVNDYFLRLDYTGDVAMAFLKGELVLDHFYYGAPWQISLKRFQQELTDEELSFYIRPLRKNAPFLSDLPGEAVPDFSKGSVVRVDSVQVVPQYVTTL